MSLRVLFLIGVLSFTWGTSGAQPKARHDPDDQIFRRAPMADASRSIVVNLSTNLHLAFDADICRVHTVWTGKGLNLWGPPYSYGKAPFICDYEGKTVYRFPQRPAWSNLETRFEAIDTAPKGGGTAELIYRLGQGRVREEVSGSTRKNDWEFTRTFRIEGVDHALPEILLAAEPGGEAILSNNTVKVRGTNGTYQIEASGEVQWRVVQSEFEEYWTEIITEQGTEKGNPRVKYRGPAARVFLQFQGSSGRVRYSSSGDALPGAGARAETSRLYAGARARPASGDEFYQIEHFPLPPEAELIITGMDVLPDGNLVICTWLGEVFVVESATGPVNEAKYRRIARGLNEPLGLSVVDGEIYVVQKGELTRLVERDKDQVIERFECVSAGWGYSGNYHSYSFGPVIDDKGDFAIFVTGQRGRSDLMYQGWALKVHGATGEITPICDGLRVPHGFGMYQDDLFITDNQGNWIGACKLNHLQPGRFYGFASSKPSPRGVRKAEEVSPPAVWFPRALSPSTSGFDTIADERFGPFQGQMVVGDFQNAVVMRVFLEKVNGEWQGAVFPFAKGFLSGVNRVKMNRDGKLYVGGGKRTWSTAAPSEWSLDRVSYTGKKLFEVREVRAETDGFTLTFTASLDPDVGKDPENYLVKQFGYKYHEEYGSPEFDQDGKPGATELEVQSARVSEDGLSVRLKIEGLKAGFVTAFQLAVSNSDDEDLRNDVFYYTLNQVPRE